MSRKDDEQDFGLPAIQQSFQMAGDWIKDLGRALTFQLSEPLSRDCLERPSHDRPLPRTGLLTDKEQIVAGVLFKYVNLGAGWRPRLFVLKDGVLRYYKIKAVHVHQLLETLRQEGELFLVGAEVSMLEHSDIRGKHSVSRSSGANSCAKLPSAQGEMHLQVASVRDSSTDYRKFYVHTGMQVVSLRAESTEDRWVWVEALRAAKGAWAGLTPGEAGALVRDPGSRIIAGDDAFLEYLSQVERTLQLKGVNSQARKYVEDLLVQEHQKLHQVLLAEESKRVALLKKLYIVENDKRSLETAMVVEGGQRSSRSLPASDSASDDKDDDNPSQLFPSQNQEFESDDEFFDVEESTSLQSGRHSREGSVTMTTGLTPRPSLGDMQCLDLPSRTTSAGEPGVDVMPRVASAVLMASMAGEPQTGDPAWLVKALRQGLPVRREVLPPPRQAEKTVSLWSLIKGMVGKDLSRVCLPVYFNEPLSALEKSAEDLEYSELLDEAATLPRGSPDRLLRVAAFAISSYSSTLGRTTKPFNPLLGETYELIAPERGLRFISEKVVHHPTIIVNHAEARHWTFDSDAEVKSKFWGRSIELRPEGVLRVEFDDGDVYVWNKVTTSINNLVLGKIYIDHGGIMRVRGLSSGLTMRVRFKETGIFDRDPRQVRGVMERGERRLDRPCLSGHWDSNLEAELEDGQTVVLWRKNPPPREPTRYNLTTFAIQLNEQTPGSELAAPTDCRRRPDQHFLELGEYDAANLEKQRLEIKQRAARKAAERGEPLRPRWFEHVPSAKPGEEPAYRYVGGYWEAHDAGEYTGCRDIFGAD